MSTSHSPSTSPHRQIVRPPKKSFFGTKETFLAPAGTGQSRSLGVQRSRRRAGIAPWINHHDVHVPLSPVSTPLQLRRPSRARGITVAARAGRGSSPSLSAPAVERTPGPVVSWRSTADGRESSPTGRPMPRQLPLPSPWLLPLLTA